jgi:hypothetical protein
LRDGAAAASRSYSLKMTAVEPSHLTTDIDGLELLDLEGIERETKHSATAETAAEEQEEIQGPSLHVAQPFTAEAVPVSFDSLKSAVGRSRNSNEAKKPRDDDVFEFDATVADLYRAEIGRSSSEDEDSDDESGPSVVRNGSSPRVEALKRRIARSRVGPASPRSVSSECGSAAALKSFRSLHANEEEEDENDAGTTTHFSQSASQSQSPRECGSPAAVVGRSPRWRYLPASASAKLPLVPITGELDDTVMEDTEFPADDRPSSRPGSSLRFPSLQLPSSPRSQLFERTPTPTPRSARGSMPSGTCKKEDLHKKLFVWSPRTREDSCSHYHNRLKDDGDNVTHKEKAGGSPRSKESSWCKEAWEQTAPEEDTSVFMIDRRAVAWTPRERFQECAVALPPHLLAALHEEDALHLLLAHSDDSSLSPRLKDMSPRKDKRLHDVPLGKKGASSINGNGGLYEDSDVEVEIDDEVQTCRVNVRLEKAELDDIELPAEDGNGGDALREGASAPVLQCYDYAEGDDVAFAVEDSSPDNWCDRLRDTEAEMLEHPLAVASANQQRRILEGDICVDLVANPELAEETCDVQKGPRRDENGAVLLMDIDIDLPVLDREIASLDLAELQTSRSHDSVLSATCVVDLLGQPSSSGDDGERKKDINRFFLFPSFCCGTSESPLRFESSKIAKLFLCWGVLFAFLFVVAVVLPAQQCRLLNKTPKAIIVLTFLLDIGIQAALSVVHVKKCLPAP